MEIFVVIGIAAAAAGGWALRRFMRKPEKRLTPSQRRYLESTLPWLGRLDLSLRAAWERQVARFLGRIMFEGCGGLELTDEMRLIIAAQACLLTLGRETPPYRKLSTILVYPTGFSAPTSHHLGSNVVIERKDDRIGESWERGQVVLAWDEIDPAQRDPRLQGNLVFHEFAHQLDAEDGEDDGVPVLDRRLGGDWQRVMGREFRRLRDQADRGEEPFLDPYGAESPAEFFAVATESYFEEGGEMLREHPGLYRLLKAFYRVDGASLG
jgi:MtfA peptidase